MKTITILRGFLEGNPTGDMKALNYARFRRAFRYLNERGELFVDADCRYRYEPKGRISRQPLHSAGDLADAMRALMARQPQPEPDGRDR